MRRAKAPAVRPEDLPPPNIIARQIAADLKTATREIQALIRDLEGPPPAPVDGQLAIDL